MAIPVPKITIEDGRLYSTAHSGYRCVAVIHSCSYGPAWSSAARDDKSREQRLFAPYLALALLEGDAGRIGVEIRKICPDLSSDELPQLRIEWVPVHSLVNVKCHSGMESVRYAKLESYQFAV